MSDPKLTRPPSAEPPARVVTPRAVIVGLVGVILIAAVTPYNDFVVANGFFIATYLPVVVVLLVFLLAAIVNPLLRRLAPRHALSAGELSVILVMLLVVCSIPNQGMLRSLLPTLVHPFYHGEQSQAFWKAFESMGLPGWLFPVEDVREGRSSSVARWFYASVPPGEPVPYAAWVGPLAVWGAFFACLFSTLISAAFLILPQWAHNERLPFPLAQLEASLIEQPTSPGRALNATLGSRGFWIAAVAVFALHSTNVLAAYFPKNVPKVAVGYDFTTFLTEPPISFLAAEVKRNTLVFLFVAAAYFTQARVGLSVWGLYLILQFWRMSAAASGSPLPDGAVSDQHLGASLVLLGGAFWVGRQHWLAVARGAFGPYRLPVGFLVGGIAGMVVWLAVVGVTLPMALLIVAFLLGAHLVAARVVAETGIPTFRSFMVPSQAYDLLPPASVPVKDVYFAQVFTMNGAVHTRESVMPFAQSGLWVADQTTEGRYPRRAVAGLIALSLAVAFVVCSASSLSVYYNHHAPLTTRTMTSPFGMAAAPQSMNPHGSDSQPRAVVVTPLERRARNEGPQVAHNRAAFLTAGVAVALAFQVLALRYASWPFLPVGYVVATTPFANWVWFSLMVGWIAKVVIVRFGGATLFNAAKPVFIGLMAGEVLAAGVWLVANMGLAAAGVDYVPVMLLPS